MLHLLQEQIKRAGIYLKTKLSGFTLVELTVVLLIIGVLASILIPVVTNRITDAKYTQAQADIAKMETALAAYELDLQDFPPSGITNLKLYLMHGSTGSANSAVKQWKGPYLDIKGERIFDNGTPTNNYDDQILDPWGNPYSYVHWRDYPTLGTQIAGASGPNEETWYNPRGFQIYSKGKNGVTFAFPFAGTESDDVNNWFGDERQR